MAGFNWIITNLAIARQDPKDGLDFRCAGCGRRATEFIEYSAVARIPIDKGGRKTADNCVILCKDRCFPKIAQDETREISFNEIPYYKA